MRGTNASTQVEISSTGVEPPSEDRIAREMSTHVEVLAGRDGLLKQRLGRVAALTGLTTRQVYRLLRREWRTIPAVVADRLRQLAAAAAERQEAQEHRHAAHVQAIAARVSALEEQLAALVQGEDPHHPPVAGLEGVEGQFPGRDVDRPGPRGQRLTGAG